MIFSEFASGGLNASGTSPVELTGDGIICVHVSQELIRGKFVFAKSNGQFVHTTRRGRRHDCAYLPPIIICRQFLINRMK